MPEVKSKLQDIINVIGAKAYAPFETRKPEITITLAELPAVSEPTMIPVENLIQKQISELEKKYPAFVEAYKGEPPWGIMQMPEYSRYEALQQALQLPYYRKYPYLSPEQLVATAEIKRTWEPLLPEKIEKFFPTVATPSEYLKEKVRARLTEKARELKPEVEKRIGELAGKIPPEVQLRAGAYERPAWLAGYRGELAGEKASEQVAEWNRTVRENIDRINELRSSIDKMIKSMTSPEASSAIASAINMYFAYDVAKDVAKQTGADVSAVYNALQRSTTQARDFLIQLQKTFSNLLQAKVDLLSWMSEFIPA